jgi:hypothetical protein
LVFVVNCFPHLFFLFVGFGSLISPNVGISFPEESETANLVKEFAKAETLEQHFGNFDQRRKDVPTFFAEKPTILAEKFNDKGKEELQNF